jgi:hypothetical protein
MDFQHRQGALPGPPINLGGHSADIISGSLLQAKAKPGGANLREDGGALAVIRHSCKGLRHESEEEKPRKTPLATLH